MNFSKSNNYSNGTQVFKYLINMKDIYYPYLILSIISVILGLIGN
jgi:uncharacterized membrane protein (DUF106 family)